MTFAKRSRGIDDTHNLFGNIIGSSNKEQMLPRKKESTTKLFYIKHTGRKLCSNSHSRLLKPNKPKSYATIATMGLPLFDFYPKISM